MPKYIKEVFNDYVVDNNNHVVRGNNRYRVKNKYELTYIMKERKDISKKWTTPMRNWGLTISQLYIKFGDRLKLDRGF